MVKAVEDIRVKTDEATKKDFRTIGETKRAIYDMLKILGSEERILWKSVIQKYKLDKTHLYVYDYAIGELIDKGLKLK